MKHIAQHDIGDGGPVAGYYHAKSLGAPFQVYLANGVSFYTDQNTGSVTTTITDVPGLIASAVRCRALHPRKLSGADLKFFRSALRIQSKVLAERIDLTPEHYSRCETGVKTMSPATEKMCRGYVFLLTYLNDRTVCDAMEASNDVDHDKVSAKDASKALAGFMQIFAKMKINPCYDSTDNLVFYFARKESDQEKVGDGSDGKWEDRPTRDAA